MLGVYFFWRTKETTPLLTGLSSAKRSSFIQRELVVANRYTHNLGSSEVPNLKEQEMKSSTAMGFRFLGKTFVIVVVLQFFVWNITSISIGASSDQLSAAISQANLSQLINASISVHNLPSSVTPSLSTLANGHDFGNTLVWNRCGYINTSAWQEHIAHCYFGDTKSKVTVALVGDSRASMYLDTFAKLGKLEHFKILFIAKDGCPSPLGTYMTNNNGTLSDAVWTACTKFHSYLISNLKKIKPRVIVVSSGVAIAFTNPVHVATGPEIQAGMTAFLSKLPASSRVIVLGGFPQPAPTADPTVCLSRKPTNVASCAFTPPANIQTNNAVFASATKAEGDAFVNQTPWFCTSTCPALIGKYIPYTADAYHADNTYLQFLIGVLWSSIERYVI